MFARTQSSAFKRQVQQSFDATAPSYGMPGDFHWNFAQRLVDHAPRQPNQTVLDVATGTAPAAIMAAERVKPHGCIIASDLSVGMVQLARQHVARMALPNLALLAADAEHLPIQTATIDGVLCSSSIVWFPNIAQALREWQRVVRPGGWMAFSCFGGTARQTINTLVIDLLRPYGRTYPELNTPLNTADKCRTLVAAAGFAHVTVHTAQYQQFTTAPDASFAQAWGLARRFNITLPPTDLDTIKAQYRVRFQALLAEQDQWNHDYEQFVVAYKPHETSSDPTMNMRGARQ